MIMGIVVFSKAENIINYFRTLQPLSLRGQWQVGGILATFHIIPNQTMWVLHKRHLVIISLFFFYYFSNPNGQLFMASRAVSTITFTGLLLLCLCHYVLRMSFKEVLSFPGVLVNKCVWCVKVRSLEVHSTDQ